VNGRGGVVTFFLFLFLAAIVLLQIFSMVRSDRSYEYLNDLEKSFTGTAPVRSAETLPRGSGDDTGDWLVWGLPSEPATLNPVVARDIYARWVVWRTVFEGLLDYDFDRVRLEPVLAESYHISDDGLSITFRLRSDARFSDGRAVTADDVIFTYNTIMNPGVDSAHLSSYYANVDKVIRVDKRTVTFLTKRRYFKSLEYLSFWGIGIVPEHVYKFSDPMDFNRHRSDPVGSGPFVFEKWDVGRQIVFRRNDRYWSTRPKLKKIVFRIFKNELAALQSLRAHTIDFLQPSPDVFAELSADDGFRRNFHILSYWTPKVPFFFIGWNQDTPFFSDRRVRLAMTHMIDRKAIITHLLKGHGRLATGPFEPGGQQHNPNIEPWPYDPQKAKRLLDQAGWRDTDGDGLRDKAGRAFRFRLLYATGRPFYDQLAKMLKDQAAGLGIEIVPDRVEWSIFLERITSRTFEAETSGWGGDVESDPYQLWHSSQCEDRGSNHAGFRHAQADALITRARRTIDETERNALYHRLHEILHYEQPYTFIYFRPEMRFLDRRFRNVIPHKLGLNPLEWFVPKAEQRYK